LIPESIAETIAMAKPLRFRVVPDGDRWRGFYRAGGKYRSQTWDTEALATAWASGMAASGATGVALPVAKVRADTAQLAKAFVAALDIKRRSLSHQDNVRHTLSLMAAAVPDLAAPDAHRQMEAWLESVRIDRVGRHKRKRAKAPSPGYRNRLIAEARAFCRWLVRKEYLTIPAGPWSGQRPIGRSRRSSPSPRSARCSPRAPTIRASAGWP
jgi:hypothetical protein